jgi:hypothetical protein
VPHLSPPCLFEITPSSHHNTGTYHNPWLRLNPTTLNECSTWTDGDVEPRPELSALHTHHPRRMNLPIEPTGDSPVFRASLSSLDHRAHALKSSCKATLIKATALRELLGQVEQVEDALFSELSNLGKHLNGGDRRDWKKSGPLGADPFDVEGYRIWKLKRRQEEIERLDTLVISRLRALRSDLKMRAGAVPKFEVRVDRVPKRIRMLAHTGCCYSTILLRTPPKLTTT